MGDVQGSGREEQRDLGNRVSRDVDRRPHDRERCKQRRAEYDGAAEPSTPRAAGTDGPMLRCTPAATASVGDSMVMISRTEPGSTSIVTWLASTPAAAATLLAIWDCTAGV